MTSSPKALTTVIIVALILQAGYIIYLQIQLRQMACDIGGSIFAERRIFYPAIRDAGLDPDKLGTEAANPFTTLEKYAGHCN